METNFPQFDFFHQFFNTLCIGMRDFSGIRAQRPPPRGGPLHTGRGPLRPCSGPRRVKREGDILYIKGAFTLSAASIPAAAYAASRRRPKSRVSMSRTSSMLVSPLRAVIRMP